MIYSMPTVIPCPQCRKLIQIPEQGEGKKLRCPLCRHDFRLPPRVPAAIVVEDGTAKAVEPKQCPSCRANLLPGAIACMDCGHLLRPSVESDQDDGTSFSCNEPGCGAENPAGERYCIRCGAPLPTASGTILHGRYRIEHQLAVGGFGAVYLATDLKEGHRKVAIKDMICADAREFGIRLGFFRREAEILRALEDLPIVPRLYDFIEQKQSAYLILEYIHGYDLQRLIETRGHKPLPLNRVIAWGLSICDVLIFMHGQSPPLIHRDLKPDNLMLLEDRVSIKMIDFGTARDLGSLHRARREAKTRVFTEGYAPPEQVAGRPEPRSDLFALASTLYHLATGTMPEGSATARKLEQRLKDGNGCPEEFRWFLELIRINLAEDPNDRYPTARDFKNDLEQRSLTTEAACASCGTPNPVRVPYCLECGQALTEPMPPCSHCGRANCLGSRYCIHCGTRLG